MKAILSDIHSNLEALQAVLEDIAGQGVEEIYCLGDVIGYGPNPRECLDLVMGWRVVLMGNHDHAVLFGPRDFNPVAEQAVFWARQQLTAVADAPEVAERRWQFLVGRPHTHREDSLLYVHGSPRDPLNEYVFPDDVYNEPKMEALFTLTEQACFQGHTHIPGIFTEDRCYYHPDDLVGSTYELGAGRVLCNVGSVGQPRDGDWRACYVLLDGQTVRYRRVEYDVKTTVQKIYMVPELDRFLGDRLLSGR